jgi:hypothetical protein
MSATDLLRVIAEAATRHEDLTEALDASGLPGAAIAAARLRAGADVPTAITGLVPARLAEMLDGGSPPLAVRANLAADASARRDQRRRLIAAHLAYPVAALAVVATLAIVTHRITPFRAWYTESVSLAWAALPAALAVLLMASPWLPDRWRLPGSGWIRHLCLADTWARAALAAQWRLTEAEARRLLGVDLEPLGRALGGVDADDHCRRLAQWHLDQASSRLAWTVRGMVVLILATGGAIVLASLRIWGGHH